MPICQKKQGGWGVNDPIDEYDKTFLLEMMGRMLDDVNCNCAEKRLADLMLADQRLVNSSYCGGESLFREMQHLPARHPKGYAAEMVQILQRRGWTLTPLNEADARTRLWEMDFRIADLLRGSALLSAAQKNKIIQGGFHTVVKGVTSDFLYLSDLVRPETGLSLDMTRHCPAWGKNVKGGPLWLGALCGSRCYLVDRLGSLQTSDVKRSTLGV